MVTAMRLRFYVDFDEADELTEDLFSQMRRKALAQLDRPPALCTAAESDDLLRRPDGKVIGEIALDDQRRWVAGHQPTKLRLSNRTRFGFSWTWPPTSVRGGSNSPPDWDRVPMMVNLGWRQLLEARNAFEKIAGKQLRCVVFVNGWKYRIVTETPGDPLAVNRCATASTAPTSDLQVVEVERVPRS